jgi:predicted transcriptional regulator
MHNSMELPFHIRALPPEALDVLRFYNASQLSVAHANEIMDGVGLSERLFGKIIRRLVTKGYLHMDGDQAYRLSDHGQEAVTMLAEFDAVSPTGKAEKRERSAERVARRLVLVAPRPFVAGTPANIQVGFHPAAGGQNLTEATDVVLRLSVINGDPSRPQEAALELDNQPAHHTFKITPGKFNRLRIRVQAFQLGPNPDDIAVAGGMYVDADIAASATGTKPVAYGADVTLTRPE